MIAGITALSGLNASVARLNASAMNVANANSVGARSAGPGGQQSAYRPVDVVQSSLASGGVVANTVARQPATITLADASSPFADAEGLVAVPNVDPAQEMVTQITALAAYRANLSTIRAADEMDGALLDRTA